MRLALAAWLAISIGCMLISLVLLTFGIRNIYLTLLIGTAAVSVLVAATRFLWRR